MLGVCCSQAPADFTVYSGCAAHTQLALHPLQGNEPITSTFPLFMCEHDVCLQVVMTYWRDPEPPDWSAYASNLQQLWHKPKWAKSIFVDTQLPAGMPQARTLQSHLQQLSAKACSVCDRHAHRPFPSDAALAKHVREQHKQHLCHICLEVRQCQ